MATRRDMTDSQKDLAAIVEEAAEVGVSRGYEQQRLVTPTPVMTRGQRTGDSAEMYEIAERVVMRNRPAEWVACEEKGPAAKLSRTVEAMGIRTELRMSRIENEQMDDRKDVVRIQQALDKFIGERDFKRWVLPLVVGVAGSSLSAALVMFVVNRLLRGHP